MVLPEGLEPPPLAGPGFESGAAASYATVACLVIPGYSQVQTLFLVLVL